MNLLCCLPGSNFSRKFIECWTNFLLYCKGSNIEVIPSFAERSNVYQVRSMCLGADYKNGIYQKPFNGSVNYDAILWLDSDMVFNPMQVTMLLRHKVDIVGGYYACEGGQELTCGMFEKGSIHKLLTEKTLQELPRKDGLVEVGYNGFGFMLTRRGVFESLEYPWFAPYFTDRGVVKDFSGEDVGFCMKARDKGYKIYVDPTLRIGHEKKCVY
jgi:hypothetical protein